MLKQALWKHKIWDKFFGWFKFCRFFVIGFWLVCLGVSLPFVPKFISQLNVIFTVPEGSPSVVAEEMLHYKYPSAQPQSTDFLLLRCTEMGVIDPRFINETTITLLNMLENSTYTQGDLPTVAGVSGYYTAMQMGQPKVASFYISPNGRSSIISMTVHYDSDPDCYEFIRDLRKQVVNWDTWNDTYEIEVFGYEPLVIDVEDYCVRDLERIEYVALPLALLVLMCMLRSITLVIIPIINVAICTCLSFALLYPIAAFSMNISVFGPPIQLSLIIAMNIDYSLFILMRYKEELANGYDYVTAVSNCWFYSGRVVLTSGTVLTITFLGLSLFPLEFVAAIGISATVGLVFTLLVSLTLTPALLLAIPCYKVQGIIPCIKKCRNNPPADLNTIKKSPWFKLASLITNVPWAIAFSCGVVLLLAPFIGTLAFWYVTLDDSQLYPLGSPSVEALNDLEEDWPPGLLLPYQVLGCTNTTTVYSEGYYNVSSKVVSEISKLGGVNYDNILGITDIAGIHFSWSIAEKLLSNDTIFYEGPLSEAYSAVVSGLVNHDSTASLMYVITSFDPVTNITDFIEALRPILEANSNSEYSFYLPGTLPAEMDCAEITLTYLPWLIVITTAVVVVMLIVVFRSLFIAARVVLTIGLTIVWVYGFSSAVFSSNWFWWSSARLQDVYGIYWLTPVLTFSFIVGLGLDYDIFLFSRIVEYREQGFSDKLSVQLGMQKTGSIVTVAGIIMAIAFGGLMLASTWIVIEMGFLEAFAVLVDTFLVRSIVVPSIVYLAGPVNWWPRKLPVKYTTLDQDAYLLIQDDPNAHLSPAPSGTKNIQEEEDPSSF